MTARRLRASALLRGAMALVGAAAALLVLGLLVRHAGATAATIGDHPWTAAIATLLAGGFVISRGLLLTRAAHLAGANLSPSDGCRLFCEGVAIEMVSWPGKVWADVYRAARLPSCTTKQRALTLAAFRAGTCAGSLTLAGLTLSFWTPESRWTPWLVAAGAVLIGWRVMQRRMAGSRGWARHAGAILGLGALASACDLAAMSIIAWSLAGVSPWQFAGWFVLAAAVASVSGLPLGLGLLDLGCWHVLTHQFHVDPAAAGGIIALYRLTGPTPTLLLGAGALLLRATPWRQAVHAVVPVHVPIRTSSPRWSESSMGLAHQGGVATSEHTVGSP